MTPLDLDMGKYAIYVWPAYAVTALALLSLVVLSLCAHARRKKVLAALQDAAGK